MKSAAKAYEIDYKLAHDRFKAKGWTIEQSLGIDSPPRLPRKSITIHGASYESIAEAARYFGLKQDTLSARLRKGISPEEAVK